MTDALEFRERLADHRATAPRAIRFLAISGSLRVASSNTALLRAVARLGLDDVGVTLYEGLASLPQYNPDLDDFEVGTAPAGVANLRTWLGTSDGLVISSPEYAHGVPGAMKNAIDWVVSCGEFYGKPRRC